MLYEVREASGPVTLYSGMIPHMPPLLGDTPQLELHSCIHHVHPVIETTAVLNYRTESGAGKLHELEDDHREWRMACAITS